MAIGLWQASSPIAGVFGYLPLVGDQLEGAMDDVFFCAAFVVCAPISLALIAVAWLLARPLVGFALLAAAALFFSAMKQSGMINTRKKVRVASEPLLA